VACKGVRIQAQVFTQCVQLIPAHRTFEGATNALSLGQGSFSKLTWPSITRVQEPRSLGQVEGHLGIISDTSHPTSSVLETIPLWLPPEVQFFLGSLTQRQSSNAPLNTTSFWEPLLCPLEP
jgi:hypothetical protein